MLLDRLHKLRPLIAQDGLDGLLLSQQENCRYVSGFTGSSGWLLISQKDAILATDFRYVEQAKQEVSNFEITPIRGELPDWLPKVASNLGWHNLGLEANHISFATYSHLNETLRTKHAGIEIVPTTGLVERLRCTKEPEELEYITEAAKLVDAAFEQARSLIHPGITERRLAWEIEVFIRQGGSQGIPFDIMVASGPNSALPHAKPSERAIGQNEPVIVDMGARINGYCSDCSRTLCLGQAPRTLSEIYDIVLEAQLRAIRQIKTNMTAAEADRLARSTIKKSGYGDAFGHGLGHGIGLSVHEAPRASPGSSDQLAEGMVFTVEPGIYIPGFGGCRIEDMVVLEEGKARALTESERVMEVL